MDLCLSVTYKYDIYGQWTSILNYPTLQAPVHKPGQADEPLANKLVYTGNVTTDRGALIHAKIPVIDPQVTVHFVGKCPRGLADEMYEVAGDQQDQLDIDRKSVV